MPDDPSACPRAIAPPRGLSFAGSAPVSASQASGTGANASFTSNASMSLMLRPVRARIFSVAGMGPVSMYSGSSPTTENEVKRARGVRPNAFAFSADMMSAAEAPSVSGDELPGVIAHVICGNRSAYVSL